MPRYKYKYKYFFRVKIIVLFVLQKDEDADYDYEYELVYDYVHESPQPKPRTSRPKIVPKQRKPTRTEKKSEKLQRLEPKRSAAEVSAPPATVSSNYNPVTGTVDIIFPPLVIR